jgi:N-formylglutamate amidohydrolase
LLIAIPHAGTYVPPAISATLTATARRVPDTDWHLEALYDFAAEMGASVLLATWSRYVGDLDVGDLEVGDLDFPSASDAARQDREIMARLCPLAGADGTPLYNNGALPDETAIAWRAETLWHPYHAKLREELERLKNEHGLAVLWDARSMRSAPPGDLAGRPVAFTIGTADGASCDPALAQTVLDLANAGSGTAPAPGGELEGGYITRHYGDPLQGVHAIQVTVAQAAYMQEAPPFDYLPAPAALVKATLRSMLEAVVRYAEAPRFSREARLLTRLAQSFSPAALRIGDAIPQRNRADWSGIEPVRALALLLPGNTGEIAAALRLCHEHRVPVVPQGGLTGLAGAAMPRADALVISLERMNAIEAIDVASATITVQAGATLQAVQEAAGAAGFTFGVDLGARGSCQVGGNLSTNAGGNGVIQFGMMREQTLGLEVVLADGTVLPMLRPMLKNNTGYDLKHWFIGAEGTLGIVTRAVMRLRPATRARVTALVALPDYASALRLIGQLQASFVGSLAAFELMWSDFLSTSLSWLDAPAPFAAETPFAALVEVVGNDAAQLASSLQDELAKAMELGVASDAVLAQSEAQARALWRIREATAEFPARLWPINLDVSLPIAQIGAFAERCLPALSERWPNHKTLRFGHLGDGNLHLTTDARSLGEGMTLAEATVALEQVIYGLLAEFGGSISAEHGIGLLKKPFLHYSRSAAELEVMRAIKRTLDPLNLLNPGKVFDPAED